MNILTLCQRGNNRSIALAKILRDKYKQRDVIAMGAYTSSQQTLVMLYDWADRIIIVKDDLIDAITPEYRDKVVLIDIGTDIWGYDPPADLMLKAERLLNQNRDKLALE